MQFDPTRHHRQSIRAKGFDYSEAGGYFVTICTHKRKSLFGEIIEDKMVLNNCGEIIEIIWKELPLHFPNLQLDGYVIMPNHIHRIIMIEKSSTYSLGVMNHAPTEESTPSHVGAQFIAPKGAINRAPTLGEIIRTFKAYSSRRIRQEISSSFGWQRNYYDHVIRNDEDLTRIRQYIIDNPLSWALDEENIFQNS